MWGKTKGEERTPGRGKRGTQAGEEKEARKERERQEKDRERQERRSPSDSADYRKRWLRVLIGYPISFILVFISTALISAICNTVFEFNTDTLDDILVKIVVLYLFIGFPIWLVYIILKRPRKRG